MPHPYLVPVSPACSRRAQRRGVSPSTFRSTDLPFTLSLATSISSVQSAQFSGGARVSFLLSAIRLGQRQRLRKRLSFTFARARLERRSTCRRRRWDLLRRLGEQADGDSTCHILGHAIVAGLGQTEIARLGPPALAHGSRQHLHRLIAGDAQHVL